MNWDAIGAIGDVIGAFAVVLSLLYLAVQIRHSGKMAEDTAFRDVFAVVTTQFASMAEGPNAEIMLKGLKNFDELAGREKYIFDSHMSSFVTLVESTFISNQARFISYETMENWSYFLRQKYVCYPGWQSWWAENRDVYVPDAQAWFDRQVEHADFNNDYWRIMDLEDAIPPSAT